MRQVLLSRQHVKGFIRKGPGSFSSFSSNALVQTQSRRTRSQFSVTPGALTSVAAELHRGEQLFAFHDDFYVTQPSHTVWTSVTHWPPICGTRRGSLCTRARTVIWNKAGICPRGCHALEDAARREDPIVWEGMFSRKAVVFGERSWRPNLSNTMFSSTGSHLWVTLQSTWWLVALLCCSPGQFLGAVSAPGALR